MIEHVPAWRTPSFPAPCESVSQNNCEFGCEKCITCRLISHLAPFSVENGWIDCFSDQFQLSLPTPLHKSVHPSSSPFSHSSPFGHCCCRPSVCHLFAQQDRLFWVRFQPSSPYPSHSLPPMCNTAQRESNGFLKQNKMCIDRPIGGEIPAFTWMRYIPHSRISCTPNLALCFGRVILLA